MIFLLLLNGFFVSMLQGIDENDYRVGGVVWGDLTKIPWIKEAKMEGKLEDLPVAVDHSANMPPVGNQGTQASCIAWAFGYYYKTYQEWLEHSAEGWDVNLPQYQFSPAFMYNLINGGIDSVAVAADALDLLFKHGCATLDKCPYNASDHTTWPTEEAFESAISYRSESVWGFYCNTPDGINNLKTLLASGYDAAGGRNAVIGVRVWSNFRNISDPKFNNIYCVADTYTDPSGPATDKRHDQHAVCVVGYDNSLVNKDTTGAFKFVNSWGTTWGDDGYGWISYKAMLDVLNVGTAGFTHDRTDYSPTLLTRFKIDHPAREEVRLKFMIDDPVVPSWEQDFFNWERLRDPECYVNLHAYPDDSIVFDLSDGKSFFNWKDTIYMKIKDSLSNGIDGELEYLEANYNGNSYTAFDAPETRSIPDGGYVTVPLYTTSWEQRYGGSGWNQGTSVVQTDDDGYVIAGATNAFGFGSQDALLFKTDDEGNVEWTQVYGGSDYDGVDCMKRSADGGYALVGVTYSYGDAAMGDIYFVKTDSMGVMDWYKTFGDVDEEDWAYSIDQCTDGGYIISGYHNLAVGHNMDGWLIKTDSLGNMEWDKTVADTARYQFRSVQQTDDGGYIVTGGRYLYVPTNKDVTGDNLSNERFIPECGSTIARTGDAPLGGLNWLYLLKTDSLGNTEWDTLYADSATEGHSVQQTSDGGYIVGGDGRIFYSLLLKVNSTGGLEWSRNFGVSGTSRGFSVLETSDYGFVLAGYTGWGMGGTGMEAYLVKTDLLGNLEWEETFGSYYQDLAASCQETSDYGFVLVGYTSPDPYTAALGYVYLVKTPAGEGPSGIPIKELPPEEISADTSFISIYSSTPNPFFNEVNISYFLGKECDVEISIHNIVGQKVKDFGREEKSSGVHNVSWNGINDHNKKLPSGIYFFRIEAENKQAIRKLVLVR